MERAALSIAAPISRAAASTVPPAGSGTAPDRAAAAIPVAPAPATAVGAVTAGVAATVAEAAAAEAAVEAANDGALYWPPLEHHQSTRDGFVRPTVADRNYASVACSKAAVMNRSYPMVLSAL